MRNSSRGLSLVEVMMYVVVAGIVVSISVSSLGGGFWERGMRGVGI